MCYIHMVEYYTTVKREWTTTVHDDMDGSHRLDEWKEARPKIIHTV